MRRWKYKTRRRFGCWRRRARSSPRRDSSGAGPRRSASGPGRTSRRSTITSATRSSSTSRRCSTRIAAGSRPEEARRMRRRSPAEQLRAFIHHFLCHVLAIHDPDDWRHRLMLREMLHPTSASDVLIREAIRPRVRAAGADPPAILPGGRRAEAACPGLQRDRPVPPLQDGPADHRAARSGRRAWRRSTWIT